LMESKDARVHTSCVNERIGSIYWKYLG